MSPLARSSIRAAGALACAAALAAQGAAPASAEPEGGGLRRKYEELKPQLERNAFGRPLHLESQDNGAKLRGDVHAVLDHPYARVRDALRDPHGWCELLVLPFNVKGCEVRGEDGVSLYVGRTYDTPVERATRIDLRFSAPAVGDDYLRLKLDAGSGPLGTRDYRIALSAVPIDERRTLVHLTYGYEYGTLSRMAMQTYLATSGAAKVGFSKDDGQLVKGMRGVLERNTMRYFLAIDAYLDTLGQPVDRRMRAWFDASEKYPKQLHEMSRDEYLGFKRADFTPPRSRAG